MKRLALAVAAMTLAACTAEKTEATDTAAPAAATTPAPAATPAPTTTAADSMAKMDSMSRDSAAAKGTTPKQP